MAVYCKNNVMKIMSKSPSRHLVRLQRNMKPSEKIYVFASFYCFFNTPTYKLPADFSGWFRLKIQSRKTFEIIKSTKYVLFKFRFWEGEGLSGCSPPPSPLGAPMLSSVPIPSPVPIICIWIAIKTLSETGIWSLWFT